MATTNLLCEKVRTDRSLVLSAKLLVDILVHEGGFPNTANAKTLPIRFIFSMFSETAILFF